MGKFATKEKMRALEKEMKNSKSLVAQAVEAGKDSIRQLMRGSKTMGRMARQAMKETGEWLLTQIPNIIKTLLCKVVDIILPLGNMVAIGKNLFKFGKQGYASYMTYDLSKDIHEGVPKKVVDAIVKQIKWDVGNAVGDAVSNAVKGLMKVAPPVGQIIAIIEDAMGYITRLFIHFKDIFKTERIIAQAKYEWKLATTSRERSLVEDSENFQAFFTDIIDDYPLAACYVMGSPLTGSFNGFLSGTSKCGECLTVKELKHNAKALDIVKDNARSYIKSHSVKLSCDRTTPTGKIVGLALDIATGKKVTPEFNNKLKRLQFQKDWDVLVKIFNEEVRQDDSKKTQIWGEIAAEFEKEMRSERKREKQAEKRRKDYEKREKAQWKQMLKEFDEEVRRATKNERKKAKTSKPKKKKVVREEPEVYFNKATGEFVVSFGKPIESKPKKNEKKKNTKKDKKK